MFGAGFDLLEAPFMHEPDDVAGRVGYSSFSTDQLSNMGCGPTGDAFLGDAGFLDYASDHILHPLWEHSRSTRPRSVLQAFNTFLPEAFLPVIDLGWDAVEFIANLV